MQKRIAEVCEELKVTISYSTLSLPELKDEFDMCIHAIGSMGKKSKEQYERLLLNNLIDRLAIAWKVSKKTVIERLKRFLIAKNKAYGNSAAEPINIFSKVSAEEQLNVRIDDKLNRLKKGKEYQGDDTIKDLAGYLILKMVIRSSK